jgi:hypothetical protein
LNAVTTGSSSFCESDSDDGDTDEETGAKETRRAPSTRVFLLQLYVIALVVYFVVFVTAGRLR